MKKTLLLSLLFALLCATFAQAATLEQATIETFEPIAGASSLEEALAALTPEQKAAVTDVDCDAGEDIGSAIKSKRKNLVIWFTGTCDEDFIINRDQVLIRGLGENPTIVGDLGIEGSTRVTLRDLTVRDSVAAAIDIQQGSHVNLINVDVLESAVRGILIEESAAQFENVRVVTTLGGTVGILNRASSITLIGEIEAAGFLVSGISATLGARYWINDGHLNLHDNPGSGAIFQINSGVTFSRGSVSANNNGVAGLFLTSGAKLLHGDVAIEANGNGVVGIFVQEFAMVANFIGFAANVTTNGNGQAGIAIQATSSYLTGASTVVAEDNGQFGLVLAELSRAQLIGTVTTSGNAVSGALIALASQAVIGGGVTLNDGLICDPTVIVQGAVACPSARSDANGVLDTLRQIGTPSF